MAAPSGSLSPEMFGLYTPAKWSSNVYNLPRMRSKDAMQALAAAIEAPHTAMLAGLTRAASDEVPNISNQKRVAAQWIYWARDATERQALATFLDKMPLKDAAIFTTAAHEKHASVALVLTGERLELGVCLPPQALVDRRNLVAKLGQSWECAAAQAVLGHLPEGAICRLGPGGAGPANASLDLNALRQGLEGPGTPQALFVGLSWPAAEALALGPALADQLTAALPHLLPLYRFVAWHRSNDAIDANKQLQAERAEKRRQSTPFRENEAVRVTGGVFRGQRGTVVKCDDSRGQVKVQLGRMAVLVNADDLALASG